MGHSISKIRKLGSAVRSWPAGLAALLVLALAILFKASTDGLTFFPSPPVTEFPELSGARLPVYTPLTASFIRSTLPLALAGIVLSALAIRFTQMIARIGVSTNKANPRVAEGESGASAVEFVMLFPMLMVLLLMVLQIALMVQAKFVVNYAAFCAARSAIVVIPDEVTADGRHEGRNQLGRASQSEKTEIIHRAAALPLTAISPLPGASAGRGLPVVQNAEAAFELIKLAPFDVTPRSHVGQVMLRAPYAYDQRNTQLTVITPQGSDGGSFKDHDWVTVSVAYRYYLTVPFIKKLFGTAYGDVPFLNILFGTDYYYQIVEQYSLPMDGEPDGL